MRSKRTQEQVQTKSKTGTTPFSQTRRQAGGLYVEMQLHIKGSFRFMPGTVTGSSSESETIHIEGSVELVMLYFDGFFEHSIL